MLQKVISFILSDLLKMQLEIEKIQNKQILELIDLLKNNLDYNFLKQIEF